MYHSWSNHNLEMLVFEEKRKPEDLEKNPSEQRREPTTNSTHMLCRNHGLNPGPMLMIDKCSHHLATLVSLG